MDNLLQKLMLSGSTVALVAVASLTGAKAQSGSGDIEQVVVSASRVSIAGYAQPTPVTVVGQAQLDSEAMIDLGDSIRELPAMGTAASPDNGGHSGDGAQGDAGVDSVALRNLGTTRTLVLFDGQRVVTSNPLGGGVDLSTIPSALVQRIDVVTGGASASWGSDAVGGVVNLIINKNFDGFKMNEELGDNKTFNHFQWRTDGSFGTDFDGGRGHIVLSGTYIMSPDADFAIKDNWYAGDQETLFTSAALYPGVAGLPTYVHTTGTLGSATYTQGGLISSGPLAGTQFVGTPGQPVPFSFGQSFGGNCVNCSATNYTNTNQLTMTAVPFHSTTLFGYGRYKLSDTVQASVQLNYGTNYEMNDDSDKQAADTILSGNPYIPAVTQAAMITKGVSSIAVGTDNLGNLNPKSPSILGFEDNTCCMGINFSNRQLMRGVFTLEGAIGNDWSWNAYAQHGQVREVQKDPMDAINANYTNAVNAVTVTTANVGASGLAIGTIACASTLLNPTNGCVPINIFGMNNVSEAALNYIDPGRNNPSLANDVLFKMYQDVFSGSMQGTLPWQVPAGRVAVAFGAEYRHEQQRNQASQPALDSAAAWSNSNFSTYAGQYEVEEGFVEVDAPILKDNVVESLDVQLAGRITSYSTSGMVETWKIGANSQLNDDFRLRATWSEDIRAPIISELFATPQYNLAANTIDPKTGKAVNIYYTAQGNTNLVPEEANNISGGIVMTPHWIPGFTASLDYYSIVIKKAIYATSGTATVLNNCAAGGAGAAVFCNEILYGPQAALPTEALAYPTQLALVLNNPVNAAEQTTSGFDFQADYAMDMFAGTLSFALLGNYNDEFSQTENGVTSDGAGALGPDSTYPGQPKLRGSLSTTYAEGPWIVGAKVRFISSAVLNNAWTGTNIVDNNNIPWVGYLDLNGSYKWNDHVQFYGTINNFTNTPPPNIPGTLGQTGSNLLGYDGLGRMYQVGVRVNL